MVRTFKFIFVIDYDAFASWTATIIRALLDRGNLVDVRVLNLDPNTTRAFDENNIQYKRYSPDNVKRESYDFAFSKAGDIELYNDAGVFTFNIALPITHKDCHPYIHDGPNKLLFVSGKHNKQELIKSGYRGECIEIGVPRYDHLVNARISDQKYFVYTDGPSFPISDSGRKQLAQNLCEIARQNPDYRMIIKPRYIHTSRKAMTHPHGRDMYYLLNEIAHKPDNITVLTENVELDDLVTNCSVLITTASTCVLPALLMNKPLLILSDLPDDDVEVPNCGITLRESIVYYENSGCVVPWEHVAAYLPDGLKAKPEFIADECGWLDGNATRRAIDVLVTIGQSIKQRTSTIPVMHLSKDNYKNEFADFVNKYDNKLSGDDVHELHDSHYREMYKGISAIRLRDFCNHLGIGEVEIQAVWCHIFKTIDHLDNYKHDPGWFRVYLRQIDEQLANALLELRNFASDSKLAELIQDSFQSLLCNVIEDIISSFSNEKQSALELTPALRNVASALNIDNKQSRKSTDISLQQVHAVLMRLDSTAIYLSISYINYYNLASALEAAGYVDLAERMFIEFLDQGNLSNQYKAGTHFHLATIYEKYGNNYTAIKHCRACQRLIPNHIKAGELLYKLVDNAQEIAG